jgi:pilus assembly protein Flp/PilA
MNIIRRLIVEEQGQDLVEYALLVAAIALALIASVKNLAEGINSMFTSISQALTTVGS